MLKIAGVLFMRAESPGKYLLRMRGPEILKAKIRKPTPNKLCLLKQIVNVNKDISFHNKENETSYMLLFIVFVLVVGARRNCDSTAKC